jgi:menaquinone-9 beta-reductase
VNRSVPNSTDVFVIGGGPAGLAAAIAARQKGFRVVLADGQAPPIDKACGEGFLPDGLAALDSLGIQIPFGEAHAFHGIRFLSVDLSVDAAFPEGNCGLAVRRTTLHRVLTERAAQLGIELLWRTVVTGISRDGVRLGDHLVRARWIVGADGANSRVRHWAGIMSRSRPRVRYAFRRHYRVAPWTDHMEVYWGERCQGYATAVNEEQVCIALASHDPKLRLEDGMRTLPKLAARLQGAEIISAEKGSLTGNREFPRVWHNNVVLIGDASGTVDAITGEGIGLAFRQAAALAESMESDDLSTYETEHKKLSRRPCWMARLMLTMDGRPRLQHRTLQVFQKHPEIFRRLVALHIGELSPTRLVWDGITLGWGLLSASR